jgi:predicted RNA-binding protein with RPS1 domain
MSTSVIKKIGGFVQRWFKRGEPPARDPKAKGRPDARRNGRSQPRPTRKPVSGGNRGRTDGRAARPRPEQPRPARGLAPAALEPWKNQRVTARIVAVDRSELRLRAEQIPGAKDVIVPAAQSGAQSAATADLENRFRPGQEITVRLWDYLPDRRVWIASHRAGRAPKEQPRAAQPQRGREKPRGAPGPRVRGTIREVTAQGAVVDLSDGQTVQLTEASCDQLQRDDRLRPGEAVELEILSGQDDRSPARARLAEDLAFSGRCEGIEFATTRKGCKWTAWLTVRLDSGETARCDVTTRVNAPARFPPGTAVSVRLRGRDRGTWLGKLVLPPEAGAPFAAVPPAGAVVEATVVEKTRFGLFCLLADDVEGLLHWKNVPTESGGAEPQQLFQPGDRLRVEVLSVSAEQRFDLRLVERLGPAPGNAAAVA